ncbi:MAG: cell division protein FtsA [SAR202 cluster bacterium]|nr:cell division protein FtsA [SAR202 cluster bacterium]
MRDKFHTGIDIGSGYTTVIIGRVGSEGELKIVGVGRTVTKGMNRGLVDDVAELKETVRLALENAEEYTGRGNLSGAYVGVTGQGISSKNVMNLALHKSEKEIITSSMIRQLVESCYPENDSLNDVLHVIPVGFNLDGYNKTRNPLGLHARTVEVESHVVSMNSTDLRNTIKSVSSNKVMVNGAVFQGLAAAESVITGDEREIGSVLIDIGESTTDLVVFKEGSPWYSTVVPVGGNMITRDISAALGVPFRAGEEIKVKYGHCMPSLVNSSEEIVVPGFQGDDKKTVLKRDIAVPIQSRMLEWLRLVTQAISASGLRAIPSGGLVITGGGSRLSGLTELINDNLDIPIRLAYPVGIKGLPSQLQKPEYSSAVGLLLWAVKHQGEKQSYPQENIWSQIKKILNKKERAIVG